jgi:hypothetical protein
MNKPAGRKPNVVDRDPLVHYASVFVNDVHISLENRREENVLARGFSVRKGHIHEVFELSFN